MNKLLTTLLITLCTTLFAQDQVAEDILNKVSTETKSYKNMTISFNFIFENISQNIKESQKGTLVISGKNFRLIMDNQTIINDGESQWVYLSDINEVQIMEHDPDDEMMSPNKLFTIYEEGYKYTYIGAESVGTTRLHIIDLFPEESGAFMKVTLVVDAMKNQLHKITIHDKNGGTYAYAVNSFISNTIVQPFTFNTTDYPDIEVIDLR